MELATLPPATARLAVELQLADVDAIMQELDADDAGDAYTAFEAMRVGFQAALLLLQDQICAMEILQADYHERVAFESLVTEERQAERDHRIAVELGEGEGGGGGSVSGSGCDTPRPGDCENVQRQELWVGDEFQDARHPALEGYITAILPEDAGAMEKYLGHDVQKIRHAAVDPAASYAESSTRRVWKGKGKAVATGEQGRSMEEEEKQMSHTLCPACMERNKRFDIREDSHPMAEEEEEHITHILCCACMEQHTRFDVLELGCQCPGDTTHHAYCRTCLEDLFTTSLTDTTLFPPRCCGKYIPILACVDLLPSHVVRQFEEKQLELASPNPVFCSNRTCAAFIKAENIAADVAVCQKCSAETCAVCKNPRHVGLCPKDPGVQMLMDVAGRKRWQRCPKCRTMVELLTGCYHMR